MGDGRRWGMAAGMAGAAMAHAAWRCATSPHAPGRCRRSAGACRRSRRCRSTAPASRGRGWRMSATACWSIAIWSRSTPIPIRARRRGSCAIHLTGNMERFMWAFDGVKLNAVTAPIPFREGERVRVTLVNDTMMAHPIHLHGHFFELVTGHGDHAPRKHTVNVAPGGTVTFDLTADAPGDWAFHCHMLYHMHAGMMQVVSVRPIPPPERGRERAAGDAGARRGADARHGRDADARHADARARQGRAEGQGEAAAGETANRRARRLPAGACGDGPLQPARRDRGKRCRRCTTCRGMAPASSPAAPRLPPRCRAVGTDQPAGDAPPPAPPRDLAAARFYDPAAMAAADRADARRAWRHDLRPGPVRPRRGAGARRARRLSLGRRGLVRRRHPPAGRQERGRRQHRDRVDARRGAGALFAGDRPLCRSCRPACGRTSAPVPSGPMRRSASRGWRPIGSRSRARCSCRTRAIVLGRVEAYYDQRVTQRLILQPRAELNLAAQDVPASGIAAGLVGARNSACACATRSSASSRLMSACRGNTGGG